MTLHNDGQRVGRTINVTIASETLHALHSDFDSFLCRIKNSPGTILVGDMLRDILCQNVQYDYERTLRLTLPASQARATAYTYDRDAFRLVYISAIFPMRFSVRIQ